MKITNLIKKYASTIIALFVGLLIGFALFSSGDDVTSAYEVTKKQEYTCSMHPNVKQSKGGDCPLCGMDLVLMQNTDHLLLDNQFEMSDRALALANVETSVVAIKNGGEEELILSGKITSNERTNATQTTLFAGRLDRLDMKTVGDYVKKGSQIGVMYSPDMYNAQDKLLTSSSYKDTHEKLYAAARNTLGLWKMNDAQIEELLKTGNPRINFPLYADVSGTITEVIASEGSYFKEGDALYKVAQLSTVWAVFDAYENELPFLKVGQEVVIKSNSFKEKFIKAKISFIEPVLDMSKRIVSVRVALNNKLGKLKPGMFVEGAVQIENKESLLIIPKSAVLWTGERSIVYKKTDLNKAVFEMATIRLGNKLGGHYIVLEGLSPGDEIVTNGTFTIDASAQLQGKKSMLSMSKPEKGMGHDMVMRQNVDINPKFKERIQDLINFYFTLKNELVTSDPEKVQGISKQMLEVFKKVETGLLDKTASNHLKGLKKKLQLISNTSILENQRKEFTQLSEHMIFIANTYQVMEQPIYVQHCPMANEYKGGDWLSLEAVIKNPYFGDKMLSCGSVKAVLK